MLTLMLTSAILSLVDYVKHRIVLNNAGAAAAARHFELIEIEIDGLKLCKKINWIQLKQLSIINLSIVTWANLKNVLENTFKYHKPHYFHFI